MILIINNGTTTDLDFVPQCEQILYINVTLIKDIKDIILKYITQIYYLASSKYQDHTDMKIDEQLMKVLEMGRKYNIAVYFSPKWQGENIGYSPKHLFIVTSCE